MSTQLYYSGKKSSKFWKSINKLKGVSHAIAYTLGVLLQNFEADMVNRIENIKKEVENEKNN